LRRHAGALVEAGAVGPAARAREGLLFALLAARHVAGIPSTHPGATKARAGGVLGVYAPPA
jgi:1,6-anhydro-N-acetylmuramate kinase